MYKVLSSVLQQLMLIAQTLRITWSADWCGSVGLASSHEAKGRQCGSQSGHMPGLRVRGAYKRKLVDVSLPLSPFPSLSKTKQNKNTWKAC